MPAMLLARVCWRQGREMYMWRIRVSREELLRWGSVQTGTLDLPEVVRNPQVRSNHLHRPQTHCRGVPDHQLLRWTRTSVLRSEEGRPAGELPSRVRRLQRRRDRLLFRRALWRGAREPLQPELGLCGRRVREWRPLLPRSQLAGRVHPVLRWWKLWRLPGCFHLNLRTPILWVDCGSRVEKFHLRMSSLHHRRSVGNFRGPMFMW